MNCSRLIQKKSVDTTDEKGIKGMRKINTGIINKFIIDKLVENEANVILNRWNYLTTKD